MDETWNLDTLPQSTEEYKKAVREILEEMKRIDLRIENHQREIQRLQRETQANLDELKTLI